ncbi:class I adenylate-forming enzyme family protein [Pseudonocardia spinosispora]|uniref:class I adenylate-forming enzyme family protein n=1 Tax=Pseudonocardia spinosispora TaxID=103441 RepID=UPI0003F77A26|nr:AMP-binding protein [Pseudonocardia spinosispora]
MLAAELVRRGARRYANRVAVVVGDREMTYAEVDERANRLANVFLSLGYGAGRPRQRVGLLADNGVWSVPLEFACLKAGVARVPLNARLSVTEQARMLNETDVRLLVHSEELTDRAHELVLRCEGLRLAGLGVRERADDVNLIAEADAASATDPAVLLAPDDRTVVLFTSGTSGTLKAAQHTQASISAITANILANLVDPGRDSAMLHAASLVHASGTFLLPYWLRGGRAVVLPGFDPERYLDVIDDQRITTVNLVPTMLGLLFSSGALDDPKRASSLDTIIYGASPMPRPMLERGLERFGPRFVQYYGQTEAPLCQTVLDKVDHTDPTLLGSCGHPAVDAEIVIADEQGDPVPPGEIGELRVRAPFAMAGYFNAPELNAQTITPGGWIRTRDMARADDRGYVHLVDRASDMIITGGYNVYPREVEDALSVHPAVAECAVVGAPDPTWVEAVTAFVSLRPGASVTDEELLGSVRDRLAGYKVPKRIEIVEEIPKSPVGKILRRALREPLWRDQP